MLHCCMSIKGKKYETIGTKVTLVKLDVQYCLQKSEKKKKKSRCNTIKCLCDPKQIKILTHSHLPLDILKGYINVYMIQLDFFLLHFIQLHILVHKNTIYKPHMWSCWNLRFSSLEYLSDESNKKSKYSYAALKWCKWCK